MGNNILKCKNSSNHLKRESPHEDTSVTNLEDTMKDKSFIINTTGTFIDYREKYLIDKNIEELGRGKYGIVRRVSCRSTAKKFAMKTIDKQNISKPESLKTEIEILQSLDHPNIMKLYEIAEDTKEIHLVTELCLGGELFDLIQKKTKEMQGSGCFSENFAVSLIRQILDGVRYLHQKKVIHRDLKPENFLLVDNKNTCQQLKIIDFGLATYEPEDEEFLTERVGTPYYCAPEVLAKRYKKSCDLWSIGIITYILLCGYPPFVGKNTKEQFLAIQKAQLSFDEDEVWESISNEAIMFIRSLLRRDPARRPTAENALEDIWITGARPFHSSAAAAEEEAEGVERTVCSQS